MVSPSTKQMASRMLDFPEPLKPVIALNWGSKSGITVLVAYDLKPSMMTCLICIFCVFFCFFFKKTKRLLLKENILKKAKYKKFLN